MSNNDWYVIIVLALVGYWGTSAVIRFFKKENDWTRSHSKSDEKERHASKVDEADDWRVILDLPSNPSIDEVRMAYKRKISMYHPDKVSSMGPEFNEIAQLKTKQINMAYDQAIQALNK